jgi:hypothetical protein
MPTTAAPLHHAAHSDAFEALARAGWVAKGVVYGIIGVLAVGIATSGGGGGEEASQQGAIQELSEKSFGTALLVALTIGLAGYALWRLVDAALDSGGHDAKDVAERVGHVVSGLLYASLALLAFNVLTSEQNAEGQDQAPGITAKVLDWPGGQWIVGFVGLVIIGVGVHQLVAAFRRDFMDELDTTSVSAGSRHWIERLGTIGIAARGVVFGLVGWFVIKAAIDYNANEATGLDGALRKLADGNYGPILLFLVALGLIVYAVYCGVEARYRRID